MNTMELKILPVELLEQYTSIVEEYDLQTAFNNLKEAELSTKNFSFYTSVASVYSSKIEGENIELDSYIKHKRFGVEFLPDYTRKIDDLYSAYQFAKEATINSENISQAHSLLTKHIVAKNYQGKFRHQNMYVITKDGRIEYVAATPFEVPAEMAKLYNDIEILLNETMTMEETFFFAGMLHLLFVKIHPWNDGNGRSARLLEKWFLAQKSGEKAWFVQSEKYYYDNHDLYYKNIRALGLEYAELDYSKALSFLLMLPGSLTEKK